MSNSSQCPLSPRTEKRLIEKQRRREMRMNGDIADKLFRPDFNTPLLDLAFNRPDISPTSSSPEKNAVSKNRGMTEDGFNKNRLERALGTFADWVSTNHQKYGISSLAPACTPSPTCIKDKRKMSRDRDPIESAPANGGAQHVQHKTDLREKIKKSRKSCESVTSRGAGVTSRGGQLTHRSLKDKMGSGEGLLDFTRLPAKDSDKRQEKRRYHTSSSNERRRSSSDRRDSSEPRHHSGERKRSQDQRRRTDHVKSDHHSRSHLESRKRPHTGGSGMDSDVDSDSPLGSADIHRLTNIFNVMRCVHGGEMSPLPPVQRQQQSLARPTNSRTVTSEVDSDSEEELDLKKLRAKMMDDSILPASPSVKSKPKLMDEASSTVKLKPKPEPPLAATVPSGLSDDSDIDSDQEPDDQDEFPLSKSVLEPEIKEEVRSNPETKHRVESSVKVEPAPHPTRFRFDSMSKQEEEEIKTEKMEIKPSVPDLEAEKRDQKPFVAVNPRMKNSSLCEEDGTMGEMLRNIKENPVSEEGLVDIRRLIASGAPFNLLLSFGYDKLSTRPLSHPDLVSSIKTFRAKRGQSESEEESKPAEKPSCKVPCIPRADHVAKSVPRSEHVARAQSVSPERGDQTPDQVYHRDKREYGGYQSKRRRIAREPPEYDTFQHSAYLNLPNGIHTIAAIPSTLAYLVQQPRNLMPPTRAQCTFASRNQQTEEKADLEKVLKGLLKFEVYYKAGYALKKEAEKVANSNQTMKAKKFMEASLQYVYAALSAQQNADPENCYIWLHHTANIIDYCLRPRSNKGLDVRIQDKRLAVLCLLLVSHIQRTIWTSRHEEYSNLHKTCSRVVRQKQKEVQSRSTTQTNTTLKVGDSPTPSPAGSLMSMASYTSGDISTDNITSDTVPARFVKDISKYLKLAQALNCWVEFWEEAGQLAQHNLGFFNHLDEQVCPISSTTHLYTVARYVGQGLINLDKEPSTS